MGLGVVFVHQLLKWEAQVEHDLDKMLEKAKAANERRYVGIYISTSLLLFSDLFNLGFICFFGSVIPICIPFVFNFVVLFLALGFMFSQ